MIRNATPEELGTIRELLVRANDAPYDVAPVAEEKCFGAGARGKPSVRLYVEEQAVRGVAVSCGAALRLIAVDRDHRRRGIGTALLEACGANVRVAFAEGGNYFTPGVAESDAATRAFFRARGFIETGWTTDLTAPTAVAQLPAHVRRATAADRAGVLAFVASTFSAIWRFEVSRAFEAEPANVFIAEVDGEIAGFVAHEANNRGLGFFGPTGVAERFRGRGLGADLLHASLADLRRLGYERALIPWTDVIEFYRKSCGAVVTGRFVTMERGEVRQKSEGRRQK